MNTELEEYSKAREALIRSDLAWRRDQVSTQLSEEDATSTTKADATLRRIRQEEADTIWQKDYPTIPHPFPGMEFLTGKEIIQNTKLFKVISKMPKGGLLHAHLDATVNVQVLLRLLTKHDVYYIAVTNAPLLVDNLASNLPQIEVFPPEYLLTMDTSITSDSYVLGTWVPFNQARQNFAFGGPEGFDNWLISLMTINPEEAYKTYNTSTKIWKKFSSIFLVSASLIRYEPVFAEYTREFILSSIEDGISYIEPRVNFFTKTMPAANGRDQLSHRDWLIVFERIMNTIREELAAQGREDAFFGAKIIYSTLRFITNEELEWYLEDCIALKKEFPHLIAGFDLVGEENAGKPLIDFIEPLLRFQARQKEEGVDIPFIFHAGETLGDGTHADRNLYDALLLGTKRIGHGFSLIKHPEIVKLCREQRIAVEVCPISNEILRLTSSMNTHPLPALLNNGVPVALCSDDPAVFGNMGLSYDYYQVFVASEINGLNTLASLARDSLEFSMLDKDAKAKALSAWERNWKRFTGYIAGL